MYFFAKKLLKIFGNSKKKQYLCSVICGKVFESYFEGIQEMIKQTKN